MFTQVKKESLKPQTALGDAAYTCDLRKVNQLLNDNASLTPTHIQESQNEIFWGNYGDDPNIPYRETPLYWAIKGENIEVIRALLAAHKRQSLVIPDLCLDMATEESNIEVINLLIEEGGIPRETLFFKAFVNNRLLILMGLIKNGFDFNLRDEQGCTFLHLLNAKHRHNKAYPLDSALYFASLFELDNLKDAHGNTPLHTACMEEVDIPFRKLLQTSRFQDMILSRNIQGETILHIACRARYLSLAETILSASSHRQCTVLRNEIILILEQRKINLETSIQQEYDSSSPWDDNSYCNLHFTKKEIGSIDLLINRLRAVVAPSPESIECAQSSSVVTFFERTVQEVSAVIDEVKQKVYIP